MTTEDEARGDIEDRRARAATEYRVRTAIDDAEYREGFDAFHEGLPQWSNPYEWGSPKWGMWRKGHVSADQAHY